MASRAPLRFGLAPPGFRLPGSTHLGAIHLLVSDLARSLDFYTEAIGLRVADRTEIFATLSAQDDSRPLLHLHTKPGVAPARPGALGLYHFAILLPDRGALGLCAAHLGTARVPYGSADHLVSEALYLSDPDGLGIEIYADRPPSTWQQRGRELAMATEPLDESSLRGSGAGRRWAGAPAGTSIGHIHLHVGDLDEARRFYHAALGFDVIVWSYPGALFFSAGGYHHHLGTNT